MEQVEMNWPSHFLASEGPEHRLVFAHGSGMSASLCHYRPEAHQASHAHDYATVSILLAGTLLEHVEQVGYELAQPALGFKPRGCRHEDRWSRSGGLMFNLKMNGGRAEALEQSQVPGWAPLRASIVELIRLCLFAASEVQRREAADDILALLEARKAPVPSKAPAWLEKVRDQIEEEPQNVRIGSPYRRCAVVGNGRRASKDAPQAGARGPWRV